MSDQTFQVGEKDYSLDELQGLIEKGNYALEMEKKYNTPFENAWSAYGKSQNELKEYKDKITEYEKNNGSQNWQEEAKKTFLTREDLDKEVENRLTQRDIVKDNLAKVEKLTSEYDGKDGKPKFEAQEALDYMKENNMLDIEKAFKSLHQDDLVDWKAKQLATKPEFLNPEGNAGEKKQPVQTRYTRDNLRGAISEALSESSGKI